MLKYFTFISNILFIILDCINIFTIFFYNTDLSFNNIEVIEGLENLVNLEDLSLYDNKISQLGGLDNC